MLSVMASGALNLVLAVRRLLLRSYFTPTRSYLRRPLTVCLVTICLCVLFSVSAFGSENSGGSYFGMDGWYMWTPGDTVDHPGYRPEQPIPISHKLHDGDKGIPCEYCHSSARRSITAGIPPMNTCMGCHRFVATDKESIKWMTEKYQKDE